MNIPWIEKRNGFIYVDGNTLKKESWAELAAAYLLALWSIFWTLLIACGCIAFLVVVGILFYAFTSVMLVVAGISIFIGVTTLVALNILNNGE